MNTAHSRIRESFLTFDWIIDHNFQNTARNFTFFIPLDSYRKIKESNVDEKIYFLNKRYSFKEKVYIKISPAEHKTTYTIKNEMKNKPTNIYF